MSEALRLADLLVSSPQYSGTTIWQAAAELRRLHAENEKLKTVMVAAAEEISEHWDAHCDSEGYGPVNLMRRLEKGIPSQYGYTAGEFSRLLTLNAELVEALRCADAMLSGANMDAKAVERKVAAALAKVGAGK